MPASESPPPADAASWTEGLANFLAEERGVEAILVNPDQRKVSVATLGIVNAEALKARLDQVLRALDARFGPNGLAAHPSQPTEAFQLQVRAAAEARCPDRETKLPHRPDLLEVA